MSDEAVSVIEKTVDGAIDCVIVIKGGLVESTTHLDFGEINIKFHASKVTQVDTTDKTKY